MNHDFWIEKWKTSDILFHKKEVNPHLLQFQKYLAPGKIFVPLCGKTLDMDCLEKAGHQVVGSELSSIACKAFFEENRRHYITRTEEEFTVYSDGAIEIWCGDFFKLPERAVAGVTSIYDRAALIALPLEDRKRYVDYLRKLFEKQNLPSILLVTIEYPQHLVEGPPFSVEAEEVQQHYEAWKRVECLLRAPEPDLPAKHPKFLGVSEVFQSVYFMRS